MGTSLIILNKFILLTTFFPFEPDLEKGYQGRRLWDFNTSLVYTAILNSSAEFLFYFFHQTEEPAST